MRFVVYFESSGELSADCASMERVSIVEAETRDAAGALVLKIERAKGHDAKILEVHEVLKNAKDDGRD
jgi:hypothetical protein